MGLRRQLSGRHDEALGLTPSLARKSKIKHILHCCLLVNKKVIAQYFHLLYSRVNRLFLLWCGIPLENYMSIPQFGKFEPCMSLNSNPSCPMVLVMLSPDIFEEFPGCSIQICLPIKRGKLDSPIKDQNYGLWL